MQLSDGGHFENLALYELVRRKCKLIVLLDGGADRRFTFSDLQNASRRIHADFGASLDFEGLTPNLHRYRLRIKPIICHSRTSPLRTHVT